MLNWSKFTKTVKTSDRRTSAFPKAILFHNLQKNTVNLRKNWKRPSVTIECHFINMHEKIFYYSGKFLHQLDTHTHTHMSKVMQNKKCLGLWSFLAAPLEKLHRKAQSHTKCSWKRKIYCLNAVTFIYILNSNHVYCLEFVCIFRLRCLCVLCVVQTIFASYTRNVFFVNKEKDVRINNKLKEIFMSSVGEEVVRCHAGI